MRASVTGDRAMAAAVAGTTAPISPQLSPAGVQFKLSAGRAPGGARSHPARAQSGVQRAATAAAADPAQVHAIAARGAATPATRLPYADRIQRAFGQHDISGILAHTGQEAAASAREIGARAYATGDHVVLDRGTDLHTVAHEAAHVIQQRAGVNLRGGVGRAGDRHEQHADAVADLVVQGRSAESRLEQYAGGSQAGGAVVQRESSFDGLLPKHETFGDFYTFKGRRSTDFTYHHIIPESKLKKVTERLTIIRDHLQGRGQRNERSQEFNTELGGLLEGARAGWLQTRVKNTTYALQQEFGDLEIQISESQVEQALKTADQLNDTRGRIQSYYKEQLEPDFRTAMREARDAVKAMLQKDFYRDPWRNGQNFEQFLEELDPKFYDRETFELQLQDALQAVRDEEKRSGTRGDRLGRRSVKEHIMRVFEMHNLEAYFRRAFPELSSLELRRGTLGKLLQENALPHEEKEHLEHAVQWNPGNIHRGPSSSKRLNPESTREFDELVDDGGDNFEKAAANLVTTEHYRTLKALNTKIDRFLAGSIEDALDDDSIEAAIEIVAQMHDLMTFGLTRFDERQWEPKGDKHMRLKMDEARLRAAGLIE